MEGKDISLVIPLFNEQETIQTLINSIARQTVQPGCIVLVDAGSADNTVTRARELTGMDNRYRILEAGRAMPGEARNRGAAAVTTPWIAFTDAGIQLEDHWLENLIQEANRSGADIIYGNYAPQVHRPFEKYATITYVAPCVPGQIRGKFIASALLKKEVWEKTGGFPNWRAAEDLHFMEETGRLGFKNATAPNAMVYWQLRQNLKSTFQRFKLYSTYNVWAGRQRYWHYGVARQYGLVLIFILLTLFIHWAFILFIPLWLLARALKRIYLHRHEFGTRDLFNPVAWCRIMGLTLAIDMATFAGWWKALQKQTSVIPNR